MGKPLFPTLLPSIVVALSACMLCLAAESKPKPVAGKVLSDKKSLPPNAAHTQSRVSGLTGDEEQLTEAEREVAAMRFRKWDVANTCMHQINYAGAIKIYTELIDTVPKKTKKSHLAFVIGQRGYARMLSGDLKGGVIDANKSLELDPNSVWTRKNRAIAYRKLGQNDLAKADELKVRQIESDPKVQHMRQVMGHYKEAMESRHQDKPEQTIIHAKRLIKEQPDSNAPWFILGDAYFETGKFEEALAAFNTSLSMRPDDPYVLNYRGTTYAQLGMAGKAIADYSRVIEIRKKTSSKQWDAIVSRYAGSFLAPSMSELYALRGELYLKQGEREKAIADCTEAIKLNPADDKARFVRATVYQHFKQTDKALTDLDDLIKVNPKDEKALQYKAEILLGTGKAKEAIVAITRAIALDDKDWHSFEIRAQCHQMAGNGKLAAQDIHQLNLLRDSKH